MKVADIEQWAPIPSAPGYEASTLGRIRSLDRVVAARAGSTALRRGRALKPHSGRGGYLNVCLSGLARRRTRAVHLLVLEAFDGPRPAGLVARHMNGNHLDNRAENLQWGTACENLRDQVRHGTHWLAIRSKCPRGHLLCAPNLRGKIRWRECLACSRARNHCRRLALRGAEFDFKQVADSYHAKIMRGAA